MRLGRAAVNDASCHARGVIKRFDHPTTPLIAATLLGAGRREGALSSGDKRFTGVIAPIGISEPEFQHVGRSLALVVLDDNMGVYN